MLGRACFLLCRGDGHFILFELAVETDSEDQHQDYEDQDQDDREAAFLRGSDGVFGVDSRS